MNLIDTSTNSPHYFYWKRIGITNENLNFDSRVKRVNQCDEVRVARFLLNQSCSSIFRNCSLGKRNTKDFRWWQVIITADKSARHYFTNNSFTWRLVSAFFIDWSEIGDEGDQDEVVPQILLLPAHATKAWIRILIDNHDCSKHDSNNCQK